MLGWVLLFPLLGAAINGLVFASGLWSKALGESESVERRVVTFLAPAAVLLSAVAATILFVRLLGMEEGARRISMELFPWIVSGEFSSSFSLLFDPLSALMCMVVTWVSFLIHLYSIGYMHEDRAYARYFAYLNLFVFFMLVLVMSDNFVLMFVGWEGVGLASYLLIGFWYEDEEKAYAGRKAFVVNRIGDFGFLLAILLIFTTYGTVAFEGVFSKASDPAFMATLAPAVVLMVPLLLFVGAVGKSAQFPLYVWLPDAMAGPTPVSALIHAATMVTAGVYMIARCNVLYAASPAAQHVVVYVAAFTAFFAATIALSQTDIKKVLAYSTVSQLGYMFMGVGSGAVAAGMFHLMTHAFFKALLFLGAGSVIHGLHGLQDIRQMGGLRRYMPVTAVTFLVATLAISGVPLLSGFFSKDEILGALFARGYTLAWAVGVVTAALTALYMFRLYFLSFEGPTRMIPAVREKVHESPPVMTVPLVVLALLSVVGGYVGVPEFMGEALGWHGSNLLEAFLAASLHMGEAAGHAAALALSHWALVAFSVGAAAVGIAAAYALYGTTPPAARALERVPLLGSLARGSAAKWFVDEIYEMFIVVPFREMSALAAQFDRVVVDGSVEAVGGLLRAAGVAAARIQSGAVRAYASLIVAGAVAVVLYIVVRVLGW